MAEPFPPNAPLQFGSDARTRVMLFATNLTLQAGEDASAVTAEADDGTAWRYQLSVEAVVSVPDCPGITAVVVRLNDGLGDVGDVLIGISYHGMNSNRVRVGIGHIGGGPPDVADADAHRSEEHTSELQSLAYLVCRLLLEK